ncbi:extracellular solute-binding protein, family 3 [Sinorhizobium meliloti]|nr:extracellular solute-binding protein, family 3 [Sinorhizobium meliloti]
MRLKSLLLPLVGLLAITVGAATASASSLDDIIARKKVMIGVDLSVPPFGITNEEMQPDGLDVDVAKLLAKDLGVELELVPVTGQSRIPSLQTGKVDFVVASFASIPSGRFRSPSPIHMAATGQSLSRRRKPPSKAWPTLPASVSASHAARRMKRSFRRPTWRAWNSCASTTTAQR